MRLPKVIVLLDLKGSIKWGNKLSFKSNNLYQITSKNTINSKRLYKNKYEDIVYPNYINSQINIDVNTFQRILKLVGLPTN